jgi:hypothetical protein
MEHKLFVKYVFADNLPLFVACLLTFYTIYRYIFAVLGLELRAYTLSHSTLPRHPNLHFGDGFFLKSCELFTWTGCEP